MKGLEHVSALGDALGRASLSPRERLQEAAQLFWQAMFYEQTWPESARGQAAALVSRLFFRGPIYRTVSLMDDEAIGQTLIDLRRFVDTLERAARPTQIGDRDAELQLEN